VRPHVQAAIQACRAVSGSAPCAPPSRAPQLPASPGAQARSVGPPQPSRFPPRSGFPRATLVVQPAFIATIGPEVETHGETTLADTVTDLQTAFTGSQSVSLADIEQNRFDSPREDDIIYLVAHGDDPGHSAVARPDLGGKSAQQIANYLKKILKGFGKGKKGKFQGSIVLEGCHTAVRVYRDDKVIGDSLLDSLLAIMQKDKFFKDALDDTVTVAGYRGSSFSANVRGKYGDATIESPIERRDYNKTHEESVHGEMDLVTGEDAAVERRWKAKPKYFG
jgi:hypothetical protein